MGFFRYSLAVVRWLKLNVYLLVRVVSYARKLALKTSRKILQVNGKQVS